MISLCHDKEIYTTGTIFVESTYELVFPISIWLNVNFTDYHF